MYYLHIWSMHSHHFWHSSNMSLKSWMCSWIISSMKPMQSLYLFITRLWRCHVASILENPWVQTLDFWRKIILDTHDIFFPRLLLLWSMVHYSGLWQAVTGPATGASTVALLFPGASLYLLWLWAGEGDRSSAHVLQVKAPSTSRCWTQSRQTRLCVTAVHAIGTYWHTMHCCPLSNVMKMMKGLSVDRNCLSKNCLGQRQSQRNDRNRAGSARLWHPGGAVGRRHIECKQNWGSTAKQSREGRQHGTWIWKIQPWTKTPRPRLYKTVGSLSIPPGMLLKGYFCNLQKVCLIPKQRNTSLQNGSKTMAETLYLMIQTF